MHLFYISFMFTCLSSFVLVFRTTSHIPLLQTYYLPFKNPVNNIYMNHHTTYNFVTWLSHLFTKHHNIRRDQPNITIEVDELVPLGSPANALVARTRIALICSVFGLNEGPPFHLFRMVCLRVFLFRVCSSIIVRCLRVFWGTVF